MSETTTPQSGDSIYRLLWKICLKTAGLTGGGGGGASAFTDLTDVPSSYAGQAGKVPQVNVAENGLQFALAAGVAARGFPAGRSVWVDVDAALQTPNGQPAYTTAQAGYNAATVLRASLGVPIALCFGRGAFGSITTSGAALDPDVYFFGLGRNISSITAIGTIGAVANSTSGNVNIKINGLSITSAIATHTMDTSGTFNAGTVEVDGDDSYIATIYAAAPAGGGNGGDVTVADRAGVLCGNILTGTSTGGKTCGDIDIGDFVNCGYLGASTGGNSGNGGAVTVGQFCNITSGIDTFTNSGTGGAITLGRGTRCGGSLTSTSSDGVAGAITTAEETFYDAIEANSFGANGPTLQLRGRSTSTVKAKNLDGAFDGGEIFLNSKAYCLGIDTQSTGTGGEVTVYSSAISDGEVNTSSSDGVAGVVNLQLGGIVASIAANSVGANGPTLNVYGSCLGIFSGATTGNFAAATLNLGNGIFPALCSDVNLSSPSGTGGAVQMGGRSMVGDVNLQGVAGGTFTCGMGCRGGDIDTRGSAGTSGNISIGHGSIFEAALSNGVSTFDAGDIHLYDHAICTGVLDASADTGNGGTVALESGAVVDGDLRTYVNGTGIAGDVTLVGQNKVGTLFCDCGDGVGPTVNVGAACRIGILNLSHVGGTPGALRAEGSSFGNINANSEDGGNVNLNLLNCVVSNEINGDADNGGTTASATIRSSSIGDININALNASTSSQFNIFASDVGDISGDNDGGTAGAYLTSASCNIGNVSLKGTSGAAGGFINANDTKFAIVDTSGDTISGQVGMVNCSVAEFTNSGSCNNTFKHCNITTVHTAGFLSRFFHCCFASPGVSVTLTSDGALFKDCEFQTDSDCVSAAVPTDCEFYNVLTRTDKNANVNLTVADYIIRPGL